MVGRGYKERSSPGCEPRNCRPSQLDVPRAGPLPRGGAALRWPSQLTRWLPEPWPEAPQGRCHIGISSPGGFVKTTAGTRHKRGRQTQPREFEHPPRSGAVVSAGSKGPGAAAGAEGRGQWDRPRGQAAALWPVRPGAGGHPSSQTAGLPFVKLPLHAHDRVGPSSPLRLLCSSFSVRKRGP